MRSGTERQRLRHALEGAVSRGEPSADLLRMAERLARLAPAGSDDAHFALRLVAELVLERAPFRAASLLRMLLRERPGDAGLHALLGLALSLLGQLRAACAAYRSALSLDPGNASYLHNLGHLLDAGLDRPREGLRWLEAAERSAPHVDEIVCSLAHARFRTGDLHGARAGIARLSRRGAGRHPDVRALAAALDAAVGAAEEPT